MTPLLLAAALAAAQCLEVDLKDQFMDGPGRDQCHIGSCATFGAIGVLEAAIFRQTGSKIRLSEADLYLNRLASSEELRAKFSMYEEGGFNHVNLDFALKNGVAKGDERDYEIMTRSLTDDRKDDWDHMKAEWKNEKQERRADIAARFMPRKWAENLFPQRELPLVSDEEDFEVRILGKEGAAKARASRAETLAKMGGLTIIHEQFPAVFDPELRDNPLTCLEGGAQAKRFIEGLLCRRPRGIPVAVGMSLKNMKAWGGDQPGAGGNHAFVLTGMKTRADGRRVYTSRNSWGIENPPVFEHELCRVIMVTTILAAADAPQDGQLPLTKSVVPSSLKLSASPF